ncbi:hypothetical protein [Cellulomonas fengjieae]|nr:hypothetical protein [Cellulomonas fengjieae]MBO3103977.1 hypothetical protein [Cellulomonas fengjieae]
MAARRSSIATVVAVAVAVVAVPLSAFLWFCSVVTGLVLALALVTVAGAW